MIKLIQNANTRKKGSLNFIDENGTVIGFNPRPDGNPISFFVYTEDNELVDTGGKFIEQYLDSLPYCFGKDGHIIKHHSLAEAEDELVISLVPDGANEPLILHIVCMNSLYYTASFVLSDKDRLLFEQKPETPEQEKMKNLAEIARIMAELVRTRESLAKAIADLDRLKQHVLDRMNAPQ